jgi:hypothetical protein
MTPSALNGTDAPQLLPFASDRDTLLPEPVSETIPFADLVTEPAGTKPPAKPAGAIGQKPSKTPIPVPPGSSESAAENSAEPTGPTEGESAAIEGQSAPDLGPWWASSWLPPASTELAPTAGSSTQETLPEAPVDVALNDASLPSAQNSTLRHAPEAKPAPSPSLAEPPSIPSENSARPAEVSGARPTPTARISQPTSSKGIALPEGFTPTAGESFAAASITPAALSSVPEMAPKAEQGGPVPTPPAFAALDTIAPRAAQEAKGASPVPPFVAPTWVSSPLELAARSTLDLLPVAAEMTAEIPLESPAARPAKVADWQPEVPLIGSSAALIRMPVQPAGQSPEPNSPGAEKPDTQTAYQDAPESAAAPLPASPASLSSRVDSAGTAAAQRVAPMRFNGQRNELAEPIESGLPARQIAFESVGRSPEAARPDVAFVPLINAQATPMPSTEPTSPAPALSQSNLVDRVAELIHTEAAVFRQVRPGNLTAVIRPDDQTEIRIHLRMDRGQVEAQASCEHGNLAALTAGWSELQTTLREHGVTLLPLAEASSPAYDAASGQSSRRDQGRHQRPEEPTWTLGLPEVLPSFISGGVPREAQGTTTGRRLFESWA